MAKFDATQFECTPDANLARLDECKKLIAEASVNVIATCGGNNSDGGKARKKLRAAKQLIGVLVRTIQVMNTKRAEERKTVRLAKQSEAIVETTNE